MRIRLTARGFDLPPSLRTLVESYFWFAISCYRDHVQDAHATLTDVREASGLIVKHCRLDIELCDGGKITIEDRDVRAEAAVQRVAERSYRMLRRQFADEHAFGPFETAAA